MELDALTSRGHCAHTCLVTAPSFPLSSHLHRVAGTILQPLPWEGFLDKVPCLSAGPTSKVVESAKLQLCHL